MIILLLLELIASKLRVTRNIQIWSLGTSLHLALLVTAGIISSILTVSCWKNDVLASDDTSISEDGNTVENIIENQGIINDNINSIGDDLISRLDGLEQSQNNLSQSIDSLDKRLSEENNNANDEGYNDDISISEVVPETNDSSMSDVSGDTSGSDEILSSLEDLKKTYEDRANVTIYSIWATCGVIVGVICVLCAFTL